MKLRTQCIALLLFMGLVTISCCKEEPLKPTSRTLLVYMAADNNLNPYAYSNITAMLEGAAGENLNGGKLLVYHDSASEPPRLFEIKKGASGTIEQEIIQTYPERNSVDVDVMKSVLAEVFDAPAYKADSYGLLLWSHGTAWLPSNDRDYLRSYGVDDNNYMEIYELQEALRGRKFDYIVFDDCYMANIEVAYTLRDNTDYILASPTEVLADGLPYRLVIKHFFSSEPLANALTKAGEAFYTYYNEQQHGNNLPKSATTALVKTAGLPALTNICREILGGKMEATFNLPLENIQLLEHLRDYTYHALYDFGDFIQHIADSPEQYNRFKNALDEVVIYKNTTDIAYYGSMGGQIYPVDKERFCGITTYIPQRELAKLNEWYTRLDWYNAVYK